MKHMNKLIAAAVVVSMALAGCGGGGEVPVQKVDSLFQSSASTASDKFAGLVVSENAVEIKREGEKSVKEVYVAEGDQVAKGDKLFSYDTDELSLTLDKQKLEMDRLDATISEKKDQISQTKDDLENASGSDETQLNIQLRTLQTELTQSEYDKAAKQKEIDYTEKMLKDVDVKSPIAGTIRKINESGEGPYMTIQQSGAYEVKGTLNELSLGAGIMEGTAVTVISRMDATKTWNGVVDRVDYDSAQTGGQEGSGGGVAMYSSGMVSEAFGGSGGSMSSSTNYPFYVKLDSTDGLLLGQHVYIQVSNGAAVSEGTLAIPENFIVNLHFDEMNNANIGEVWAANRQGKLEKVQVTFGEFDPSIGGYGIIDGLTADDYIADPSNPECTDGAKVSYREESDFVGNNSVTEPAQEELPVEDVPHDENQPSESTLVEPVPEDTVASETPGNEVTEVNAGQEG